MKINNKDQEKVQQMLECIKQVQEIYTAQRKTKKYPQNSCTAISFIVGYLSLAFKKQVPLKLQHAINLWLWIFRWFSLVKILQFTIGTNKYHSDMEKYEKCTL